MRADGNWPSRRCHRRRAGREQDPGQRGARGTRAGGLVSAEFYRGFRVAPLDAVVIHESFELYGLLASYAVRQVTGAADQAELGRLAAVGAAALVSPVSNADFFRLFYAYRRELHKAGGSRRLRHLLAGFRASLSAAGHVIDAVGIASVQEALTAEVCALRTGAPDLAARATFQTLLRNGQVIVDTLVARGVISAAGSPAVPNDIFSRAAEADEGLMNLNS